LGFADDEWYPSGARARCGRQRAMEHRRQSRSANERSGRCGQNACLRDDNYLHVLKLCRQPTPWSPINRSARPPRSRVTDSLTKTLGCVLLHIIYGHSWLTS
jgi:hypothetical protein